MPFIWHSIIGVGERVRTSAAFTDPTSLANSPLQPLGYTYIYHTSYLTLLYYNIFFHLSQSIL